MLRNQFFRLAGICVIILRADSSPIHVVSLNYGNIMNNLSKTPKTTLKKLERIGRKTKAVSPVVATLVLIVVAIVGAISVGLIMSRVSTDTGAQANVGNVAGGTQATLVIGGSTTLYPITEAAKPQFESTYHVNLQDNQGGSNAGMQGVISGALDIGAASSSSAVATAQSYILSNNIQGVTISPTLIGGSGIVVVENGAGTGGMLQDATPNVCTGITLAALKEIYTLGTFSIAAGACAAAGPTFSTLDFTGAQITAGTTYTAVSRSDNSGTEDTFTAYVGLPNQAANPAGLAGIQQPGNAGVLTYVKGHASTIGFADIGFAEGKASGVTCPSAGNACGVGLPQVFSTAPATVPLAATGSTYGFVNSGTSTAGVEGAIKAALKSLANVNPLTNAGATASFPDTAAPGTGLARTFYYVTNGPATPIESEFLHFITTTGAESYYTSNGYFSVYDFSGA